MKKSELKTGDQLTFRDGQTAIVLLGTRNGDIFSCIGADGMWGELLELNEDLTHRYVNSYDVVKVSKADSNKRYLHNYETIWEREQAPEYVELLCDTCGYKKGDIANVVGYTDDSYEVFVPHRESYKPNVLYMKKNTKPSTKQAYEAQVPEYVELLCNLYGYKKGDIAKVIRDTDGRYEVFVPYRESTSVFNPNVRYSKKTTKPSTKQAYESQTPEYTEEELTEMIGHNFKIKK